MLDIVLQNIMHKTKQNPMSVTSISMSFVFHVFCMIPCSNSWTPHFVLWIPNEFCPLDTKVLVWNNDWHTKKKANKKERKHVQCEQRFVLNIYFKETTSIVFNFGWNLELFKMNPFGILHEDDHMMNSEKSFPKWVPCH